MAAAAWRWAGPVHSLALAEFVETRMQERLGQGASVSLPEASLQLKGASLRLSLLAPELTLGGEPPLRVNAIDVDVALWPFLVGRTRITGVTVRGGELSVPLDLSDSRIAQMRNRFGPQPGAKSRTVSLENEEEADMRPAVAPPPAAPPLAVIDQARAALAQFFGAVEPFIARMEQAGLWRVQLQDMAITFEPQGGERAIAFAEVQGMLTTGASRELSLDARLLDRSRGVPIALDLAAERGSDALSGSFSAFDFVAEEHLGPLFGGAYLSSPITLRAELRTGADQEIEDARLTVSLGAGHVGSRESKERRLLIDEADFSLHYDGGNGAIGLDRFDIVSGESRLAAKGTIEPWAGDPAGEQMRIEMTAEELVLADPSGGGRLVFDRASLDGIIDPGSRFALFHRVALSAGDVGLAMSAEMKLDGAGPVVSLAGAFSRLEAPEMKSLWLPTIAPGARAWVMENLQGGHIEEGSFTVGTRNGGPGEGRRLESTLDMRIGKAAFSYFGGLAPVEISDATLALRAKQLSLTAEAGRVPIAGEVPLEIHGANLLIDGLGTARPQLMVDLNAVGPVRSIVAYVQNSRLDDISPIPFSPRDIEGSADAELHLEVPLGKDVERRPLLRVAGHVREFGGRDIVAGRTLAGGDLQVELDMEGLAARGTVEVDGVPSRVDFYRAWREEAERSPGVTLTSLLDAEGQEALGLSLQPMVDGPVTLRLVSPLAQGKPTRVELDLAQAAIRMPELGYAKPAGPPARLAFAIAGDGPVSRLEDFELTAPSLELEGTVDLGSGQGVRRAVFSKFRLSDSDDVALTFERPKSGEVRVSVKGASFDVRPFLEQGAFGAAGPAESGSGTRRLSLDVAVDRLIGKDEVELRNARLRYATDGPRLVDLAVEGKIDGRWPLAARMATAGGRRSIVASSPAAGPLLRFLGLYRFGRSGELDLRMTQAPSQAWAGTLKIDDFTLSDDPVIEQLVQKSQTGHSGPPPALRSEGGLSFAKLRVDFTHRDGRVRVGEGVLKGPALGVSFNGLLDLSRSQIDMAGTFVPFYALNNAFAQVPILGPVLGGGRNEGLLGMTFRLAGPAKDPALSINPVSMLAPGFLRRLFDFSRPARPDQARHATPPSAESRIGAPMSITPPGR